MQFLRIRTMYKAFIDDIRVNVKFSVEYANDIFPLLNFEVHFTDELFDTTVYRKPTHTGQILQFVKETWQKTCSFMSFK